MCEKIERIGMWKGEQMAKFFQAPVLLRVAGTIIGLISIFGGIAAWIFQKEPERYLVSAVVMFCSGILWLLSSIIPRFRLHQRDYVFILAMLCLGLMLGLFHTYTLCGGMMFCHQTYGYPGRWLTNSRCMATSTTNWWDGTWGIDFPSFVADVVFWSGAGLIILFIRDNIKLRSRPTVDKN
jgi:hypothetical protein